MPIIFASTLSHHGTIATELLYSISNTELKAASAEVSHKVQVALAIAFAIEQPGNFVVHEMTVRPPIQDL